MENLKDKNLAFFMNYFSSLEIWDRFGIFSRESSLYNLLADHFDKIYIFTYGSNKDLEYAKYFKKNVIIVPKKINVPNIIYELLLPFIERKIIKKCSFYKTNQNSGIIAPAIAKILNKNSKFIVRSGYIGSEHAKLAKFPFYARSYFWLAENFAYRFCDKAFIPNNNSNLLIGKYPFLRNKLVTMNNFINVELFKKNEMGKKYDIIYVARLDKDKNHLAILKAVKGKTLKIIFIGQGKEKDNIISFAEKNNISVKIIDKIPNNLLPDYYNSSRMCIFPSLHEGNPKTLLEAMSCGLPVIGFNVIGVNSIIQNDKNGLLLEYNDIENLRKDIGRVLNDNNLSQKLSKSARKFIKDNFSLDTLLSKELDVYKDFLNKTF
jgi:glycosyltransferase involved in cell wall biosynthesis